VTTLKDTGVDTGYLQWDLDQPTGWSIAMVRPDGQRNLLSFRGANRGLHLGERQIAAISASRWVHLSDPLPWMVGEVAGVLPPGTRLSLDPGGITAARGIPPLKSILKKTSILFCNQAELATLTGIPDRDTAVKALLDKGPETVVVKLGAQGCQVQTASTSLLAPGFLVQAVDSTGAGDTFDAAFLTAVLSELPFTEAARFANAAGALATLGIGAQSAQPTRQQLEPFLNTSKDVNA
jgi:ribokinase